MEPEVFFVRFSLDITGVKPCVSNGGYVYKPGVDQIPGTCMDYYAIDGWVLYKSKAGSLLWSAKDSPLVCFGRPMYTERIKVLPDNMEDLYSMIFDNTWDTNFSADNHGTMEFTYNLIWKERIEEEDEAGLLADSLAADIVTVVKV